MDFPQTLIPDHSQTISLKLISSGTHTAWSFVKVLAAILFDNMLISSVANQRITVSSQQKAFLIYYDWVLNSQLTSYKNSLTVGASVPSSAKLFLKGVVLYTIGSNTTFRIDQDSSHLSLNISKLDVSNHSLVFIIADSVTKKLVNIVGNQNYNLNILPKLFPDDEADHEEIEEDIQEINTKLDQEINTNAATDGTQSVQIQDLYVKQAILKGGQTAMDNRLKTVEINYGAVNSKQITLQAAQDLLKTDFLAHKAADVVAHDGFNTRFIAAEDGIDNLQTQLSTTAASIDAKIAIHAAADDLKYIKKADEGTIRQAEFDNVFVQLGQLDSKIDQQTQQAHDYADTLEANAISRENQLQTNIESYIDTRHLEAKNWADTQSTAALNSAKAYTDTEILGAHAYTDATVAGLTFVDATNPKLMSSLDCNTFGIIGLSEPVNDGDATTKKYVDDQLAGALSATYIMGTDLDMQNKKIENVLPPTGSNDVMTLGYYELDRQKLKDNLDCDSFRVQNLPVPLNNDEAVRKDYCDIEKNLTSTKGLKRYFSLAFGEDGSGWDQTMPENNEFTVNGDVLWKKIKTNLSAETKTAIMSSSIVTDIGSAIGAGLAANPTFVSGIGTGLSSDSAFKISIGTSAEVLGGVSGGLLLSGGFKASLASDGQFQVDLLGGMAPRPEFINGVLNAITTDPSVVDAISTGTASDATFHNAYKGVLLGDSTFVNDLKSAMGL